MAIGVFLTTKYAIRHAHKAAENQTTNLSQRHILCCRKMIQHACILATSLSNAKFPESFSGLSPATFSALGGVCAIACRMECLFMFVRAVRTTETVS